MIYSLIFSNILAATLPSINNKYAYIVYLMAGILAWNLFSEIVSRCLNLLNPLFPIVDVYQTIILYHQIVANNHRGAIPRIRNGI